MALIPGYAGINNAVNKHGRQIPLASIKHEKWATPAAAAASGFLNPVAGPNTATNTYLASSGLNGSLVVSGVAQLTFHRSVTVTVTHSSAVVALSGVISGTDQDGTAITEAWSVTAGGTSKTYATGHCFKTISSITVIAAADASADTVSFGTNNTLGLTAVCSMLNIIAELLNGVAPSAGALVAGVSGSATKDYFGTYTPQAALDVTKTYEVAYITDSPVQSAE